MTAQPGIRFGFGPTGGGTAALLDGVTGPDRVARAFPMPAYAAAVAARNALRDARKRADASGDTGEFEARRKDIGALSRDVIAAHIARAVATDQPFRERLVWFWADHFTIGQGLPAYARPALGDYLDRAIRPHVGGGVPAMLRAVVTHPAMLLYLDQAVSVGPNSRAGQRRGRGLNENLAREVMELHTLGVGGPYDQADVGNLAALMTGLTIDRRTGDYRFQPAIAEPGAQTVLGRRYGGAREAAVFDALDDLARHPATARHLARKLAVHFISDTPDPALVDALADAYGAGGGALMPLYEILLAHPPEPAGMKVRQPADYLVAVFRALGMTGRDIAGMDAATLRRAVLGPLRYMGQVPFAAKGPDGWPEEAAAWITPQGLATRIGFSMRAGQAAAGRGADPATVLDRAFAGGESAGLRFAAAAAESRAEALGVILASTDMNRR